MRTTTSKSRVLAIVSVAALGITLGAARDAQAGRGGSSQAIRLAIQSGSVDAIQAELERAEFLVCGACADLVLPLIDHGDQRVRQVAAWWLSRRSVSRTVRLAMLTRLSQPDSTAARNAADVLGEFHYVSSISALGAALSNPVYSGEARAAMARALGTINRPAAVAPLTAALASDDAQVRAASLAALRSIVGQRDAAAVVPLVGDADESVRAEAIWTLGTFRMTGAADALVVALKGDPSVKVRSRAAWALGAVRADVAVAGPALEAAAKSDASPAVRSLAAVALTRLGR
jgi:HEAT repeat protein